MRNWFNKKEKEGFILARIYFRDSIDADIWIKKDMKIDNDLFKGDKCYQFFTVNDTVIIASGDRIMCLEIL